MTSSRSGRVLYPATLSLSAFLLFCVQPLIGRYLLPWFGGGAAVWSAVTLCFQVLLLGGYAYGHGLVSHLRMRHDVRVHRAVVLASVALLLAGALIWPAPILPGPGWQPPDGARPLPRLLLALVASVGLPYFVLSATGPLVQAWFARAHPGASPYPLYALSNAASLLALVGYPFVVDPLLALRAQAWLWCALYGLLALALALLMRRVPVAGAREAAASAPPPSLGRKALWVALAASAAALLVATTNQITQNVASVPLLWVLPLALYLLSFVLCFARRRWYGRYVHYVFALATIGCNRLLPLANAMPLTVQLPVYALALFSACMACHGELARLRPAPAHLTSFYLALSLGGALGGALVNLLAPAIFDNFWEFPLGLLAVWILLLIVLAGERRGSLNRRQLSAMGCVAMIVATALSLRAYARAFRHTTLAAGRNFYGVVRVQARSFAGSEPVYAMVHGTTIHGVQAIDGPARREPLGYYGPTSGLGMIVPHVAGGEVGRRVGVLGLGAGSMAAHGRAGDVFRFYEIDPQVIRLAQGEGGYFSYLADTPARVEIVPGDARLSLERELAAGGGQGYDLLLLDVFSGDAVAVHLLTRESFALYLTHLSPQGVLAVNISTTHLDLQPVLARMAEHFDLAALVVEDWVGGEPCCTSRWALLARDPALLDVPGLAARGLPLNAGGTDGRLWTDDYSNVLGVINW